MDKNRRANTVVFGFDFQVNAAIVLMLENMKEMTEIRLEGASEDIEITLKGNQIILAQAKSVVNSSSDFNHVRENLKKSLCSLSEGAAKNADVKELILITNSPNPFKDDSSRFAFYGETRRYFKDLPPSAQKITQAIIEKINKKSNEKLKLDLGIFKVQILPFETDNDLEKYKVVKNNIRDFLGELDSSCSGITNKLMEVWQQEIFKNGSKKDVIIKLNKKEIVWPIIVFSLQTVSTSDDVMDDLDTALALEVEERYKLVIDVCTERYDFFAKVLCDYKKFEFLGKQKYKIKEFVKSHWKRYKHTFQNLSLDEEIEEALIKIILYKIIYSRIRINSIKKGTGL